ncbi:MAG TPA: hypothetical protein VH186_25335 [Chloroflexia bacterium]|nr:hypothetical protein [Chloroflexia bacterium]
MYNNYPNHHPYGGQDERNAYPPEGYRPENYPPGIYQSGAYQSEGYRPDHRPYPPAPNHDASFSEAGLAITIGLGVMFLLIMVGFHSFFFFPILFFFWPFFFWGPRHRRYYRRTRNDGRHYDPYNQYNQGYYQGWGQYPPQNNYAPPQGWPQNSYRPSGWPEPPQPANPTQPADSERKDI